MFLVHFEQCISKSTVLQTLPTKAIAADMFVGMRKMCTRVRII